MDKLAEHTNNVKSSEVVGVSVMSFNKENLGKVYELVLDKVSGKVNYVVLESGSFLGMGGKFFAIPWRIFKFDTNENAFVVNINKDQLSAAPGFDKNNWPKVSNPAWNDTINNYYNFSDSLI